MIDRLVGQATARATLVGVVFVTTACIGPVRHADGGGPLASGNDPDTSTSVAVERTPGIDAWSFGMFLCMREPGQPAVLRSVVPHDSVGAIDQVGAVIHEFTWSSGESGTGSADGFPPAHATEVVPIGDYEVDIPCTTPPQDRAAEVIVGLRPTDEGGGGWLGADVLYSVGRRDYVLEIRNDMVVCGEAAAEYCDAPIPSDQ
jgi:hypothetical protein